MNLVFVHGAGCTGDVFAAQIAAFPGALAITLPGHRGDAPYDHGIAGFADAVAAELDARGLESIALCGHSMGGAVALELALRGDARVRALVLVGSGAKMRVAPAVIEAMQSDFPPAARDFASRFFAQRDPERERAAVETMLRVGREQTVADLRACDAFDAVDRLAGLRVPALALTGASDALTPPKYTTFLADRIPGAQARILDGAGHFAFLERPDATNDAIAAFLERAPA